MKLKESIKPISQVKAHLSKVVEDLSKTRSRVVITHNGEAKAVLQDIESYEELQESLTMLKLVAMSARSMVQGKGKGIDEAFTEIRRRVKEQSRK
jgi:prevent-host-death family protein